MDRTTANSPAFALLSTDLMFSSAVAGCVRSTGGTLAVVSSPDELLQLATKQALALVLIDLTTAGTDVGELVPRLRAAAPAVAIVAYGPHVHEQKLDAARGAGCNQVVTRGQFHARMAEIVASYVT